MTQTPSTVKTDISDRNMTEAPKAIQTALRTARRDGITKYLFPTYYGLRIENDPQPATKWYEVEPDGRVSICERQTR